MDEGVGKSGSSHGSPPPPSAGSSRGSSSSASPGTMSRRGFPGGDLRQQAQQPPRPELPPAFSVPTANTTPHDTAITRVLDTHVYARLTAFFSWTTRVSRYQKGKTNLDFTEARDREWQWHQLGSMQVCTSLQTDNHASTTPLKFSQAGRPSCRPTNSVKAARP